MGRDQSHSHRIAGAAVASQQLRSYSHQISSTDPDHLADRDRGGEGSFACSSFSSFNKTRRCSASIFVAKSLRNSAMFCLRIQSCIVDHQSTMAQSTHAPFASACRICSTQDKHHSIVAVPVMPNVACSGSVHLNG